MNIHRLQTRAQKEVFRRLPKTPTWGSLAAPVNPLDNTILARAMSLTGRRQLSVEEAQAIVEHHDREGPQPLSWWQRTKQKVMSCVSKSVSS